MRRLIVMAGLAICLGLAVSTSALARSSGWQLPVFPDPPGGVQPPCADITPDITGAFFTGTEVLGTIGVAATTCPTVNYTMVVFNYGPTGFISGIHFQTLKGDGLDTFMSTDIVTGAAPAVCVFFVTTQGWRLKDVAPDNSCPLRINRPGVPNPFNVLFPDSAPGGGFFG